MDLIQQLHDVHILVTTFNATILITSYPF